MRRALMVMATVALFGAGMVVNTPVANAAVTRKVSPINFCGNACNAEKGAPTRPTDMLDYLDAISSQPVAMYGLSEVCFSQYQDLVENRGFNRLVGGRGFAYYFTVTATDDPRNPSTMDADLAASCGTTFGNVLFIRGAPLGAPADNIFPTQDDDNEDRPLCVGTNYGGLEQVGCAVHIDATAGTAEAQVSQFYDFVAFLFGSKRRFIAGDFNTTNPAPWYNGVYFEGDPYNRWTHSADTTKSLSRKIDYVWADGAHQSGGPGLADVGCNTWPTTDHCLLGGYFNTL